MPLRPDSHYTNLLITGANRNQTTRQTQVAECTQTGRSSPSFSAGLKEGRAKAEYWMKWDSGDLNIPQLRKDFIGYSSPAFSLGQVVGIYRSIPYPHPSDPNYLYCDALPNIEGDVPVGQDANGVTLYDEAKITATFSTRPYEILSDGVEDESSLQQYVTISPHVNSRWERVPSAAALVWGPDGPFDVIVSGNIFNPNVTKRPKPVSNMAAVILCEGEVEIVWHQIPVDAIPWAAIANCVGKCDGGSGPALTNVPYTFLSDTYIGPVFQTSAGRQIPNFVCLTPKISEAYKMVDGNYAVDIAYKFKYFPFGVDYYYSWEFGKFCSAVQAGTGRGFYQAANFNTLFLGN